MIKKIGLLFILIALISPACALTISGVIKYEQNVIPNEEYNFITTLSRTGNEDIIHIESVTTEGECSNWITVNKTPFIIDTPIKIPVKINVPSNSYNGKTSCIIKFTSAAVKDTAVELGLPLYLNVTSNNIQPISSPTTIVTTLPTIVPTTIKPTVTKTQNISSTTSIVPGTATPIMPAITFLISGLLVVMLVIVVIVKYKKKDDDGNSESIILE